MGKPNNSKRRVKKQFIGRHLMIKGEHADKLLRGIKETTIRLGVVKPKYDEVIIHGYGRPLAKAKIVSVRVKKVKELTIDDARRDGFKSVEELLDALESAYGKIREDDPVTIITLKVIKRLDNLESSHPYLGLDPVDIARLALRYIPNELAKEEAEIMKTLTATNSIRRTAIRLYGDLEKRWMIRRVLKRALRLLIEKGIINP
ncbi:MAG: ASCH domain-containing protein [Desulfurococcales archaeon]|nr:ASCH domain-containing protein [Desulfurococcales archaeon]